MSIEKEIRRRANEIVNRILSEPEIQPLAKAMVDDMLESQGAMRSPIEFWVRQKDGMTHMLVAFVYPDHIKNLMPGPPPEPQLVLSMPSHLFEVCGGAQTAMNYLYPILEACHLMIGLPPPIRGAEIPIPADTPQVKTEEA